MILKISKTADGMETGYWLWCPGCEEVHRITNLWVFDGNEASPSFSPSILVTSGHYSPQFKQGSDCWCTYNQKHPDRPSSFECERCHSFIRNGQWQFLGDCTHHLANQTVPMVELPSWIAEKYAL